MDQGTLLTDTLAIVYLTPLPSGCALSALAHYDLFDSILENYTCWHFLKVIAGILEKRTASVSETMIAGISGIIFAKSSGNVGC